MTAEFFSQVVLGWAAYILVMALVLAILVFIAWIADIL